VILHQCLALSHAVNAAIAKCCQQDAGRQWQVVTFIVGSKRWSLLMAADNDEVLMTRSVIVMPKTTEQHLIVRSGKSEVEVTITEECIRRIVLLKLTFDRYEALRSLSTTAELLVMYVVRSHMGMLYDH